ncbi:MAG: hypothetical protein RIC87_10595 [Kiloniellales bacterium]
MQVPGLVGAMEIAEADVNDPGRERASIIARAPDGCGEVRQRPVAEGNQLIH